MKSFEDVKGQRQADVYKRGVLAAQLERYESGTRFSYLPEYLPQRVPDRVLDIALNATGTLIDDLRGGAVPFSDAEIRSWVKELKNRRRLVEE